MLALCREACQLVDLREHAGNHPCLGAVDLVPIHPLTDDTALADCATLARGTEVQRVVQDLENNILMSLQFKGIANNYC